MRILIKIKSWIFPIGALFIIACAQQGAPTGGVMDERPPVLLKATPENYSTNFEGEKILITFDEYLDMGNFTQELVVSPPMEEKPIVKLRNKTLIIEFEEKLKDDVTYTFNFGEGIKDLNEKNILMNFEYVFSTGNYLDSLSIKGTLKNAYDLSVPETPIFVMLYNELEDSLPLIEIPYYVGRTDKDGNFAVNNLKAGIYKLFVLKDGNNNFLFDLPSEQIAFLDTSIVVDGDYFRRLLFETGVYDSTYLLPDTLALTIDTTGMSPDSIFMVLDSLKKDEPDFNSIFVDLFMFLEDPINQFISDYSREERNSIEIIFNLPLTDSFSYKPVFPPELNFKDLIPEFGKGRDSLTLWLGDTIIASMDTIMLSLHYTVLDTLKLPVLNVDTLQFTYREKQSKKQAEKGAETKKQASLKVVTVKNNGKHHPLKNLDFVTQFPINTINPSLFELYTIPDSTEIREVVSPLIDSTHLRRITIDKDWIEEVAYRVVLYPGAIYDIYGSTNDTLDIKFIIKAETEYGRINLNLEQLGDTLLIEVYKKDKVIRSRVAENSGTYTFDFMEPDTYRIKLLYDANRNGKWDSGKYMESRQPERVEFLPVDLKIRANWDHDITYIVGSNTSPPAETEKKEVSSFDTR